VFHHVSSHVIPNVVRDDRTPMCFSRSVSSSVSESAVIEKSVEAAKQARLRYVTDDTPGITRKRAGKSFNYVDTNGKRITDADTLARIGALVIPPAWTEVWICPDENGHLQATGRDARGRKQHRYHPKYRAVRDEAKYERMIDFAKALPKIHRATAKDLAKKGLTKEKVLAAVIRVMQKTLIRVGNEEYAKQNDSYGLTTLEDKHAKIRGGKVRFEFRGKSGKEHEIDLEDPRLASIVKQCQELPGEQLFQYLDDDGNVQDINSSDVNEYLRSIVGEEFTAKDFRTWAGTVLAARALSALEEIDSNAARKKNIVRAIEAVAQRLGNTKAVCRKCYIHPEVLNAYMDGSLAAMLSKRAGRELARTVHALSPEEAAVLALLQQNLLHASARSSERSRNGQNGRAKEP
jgi:DNA topoisomerase I